ncbi:MAG: TPM domain-containing protein [Clostridium sp.]|nr:TPM domain-containing protein [Clostridium sp.]MCM1547666.1 TPM domain-containing protein [Ruminococcus sp.]
MKKLIKMLLPAFICLFCMSVTVSAEDAEFDFTYPYVVDSADLISNDEQLSDRLEEIGKKYYVDIVVVTVDSLDGKSATAYADDFYDYNGYSDDGILFLISMEYRDWAISTKGYGIKAFTDYGCDYIFDCMSGELSENDFESAFNIFADQCEKFLAQAEKGKPFDTNNNVRTSAFYSILIKISVIIGLIVAFIVTLIMKGQLKSVKFQHSADSYIENNSIRISQSNDIFLYKTLSKTKIESSSGSSSSRGGGSHTHRSSSGSSHGGRSGKF